MFGFHRTHFLSDFLEETSFWTDLEPDALEEPERPEDAAERDRLSREELEVFGLVDDGGIDVPAYQRTLADLSEPENLGALGLLGAGEGGPEGGRSLANATPWEFLGMLGLHG